MGHWSDLIYSWPLSSYVTKGTLFWKAVLCFSIPLVLLWQRTPLCLTCRGPLSLETLKQQGSYNSINCAFSPSASPTCTGHMYVAEVEIFFSMLYFYRPQDFPKYADTTFLFVERATLATELSAPTILRLLWQGVVGQIGYWDISAGVYKCTSPRIVVVNVRLSSPAEISNRNNDHLKSKHINH